jgi:hypothetical protein
VDHARGVDDERGEAALAVAGGDGAKPVLLRVVVGPLRVAGDVDEVVAALCPLGRGREGELLVDDAGGAQVGEALPVAGVRVGAPFGVTIPG